MEEWLSVLFSDVHIVVLFAAIVVAIALLVKGADLLVEEAVALSVRWGVPKILIGATIVSLGTTLPETAVSVFAALTGSPGLALGNAVGSIIADTGLILGMAVVIGPIPVDRTLVSRQSWIQFGSALLLVLVTIPYRSMQNIFHAGGHLPQLAGVGFIVLLVIYMWRSIRWSKDAPGPDPSGDETDGVAASDVRPVIALIKLLAGIVLVLAGSQLLIPAVEETASRLRIPDAIIAATIVALGTSLPELVTAITAVRKKHGELALGNVIGADVLNVLFVSGASAAVTRGGLDVPPAFFYLFFPSMLFVVMVLRIGVSTSKHGLTRGFGFALLAAYVATVAVGYLVPGSTA